MKKIYINLKRFDIPRKYGGISFTEEIRNYGESLIHELDSVHNEDLEKIVIFLPEAHILSALASRKTDSCIEIGCQGVFREDVGLNGAFGAFTTQRTAKSAMALGCTYALIGHFEERKNLLEIMQVAGLGNKDAVSRILNKEVKMALSAGLKVLFCVGETSEEQSCRQLIIEQQLSIGLDEVDKSKITIAYEPIWAIGPGKTPPDKDTIEEVVKLIKNYVTCDVVYGGGLKSENAEMLHSIQSLDGGLIGLTRFSGDIGFYPEECDEIIQKYIGKGNHK